jgi:MYXO-CTERM domain-containing protein
MCRMLILVKVPCTPDVLHMCGLEGQGLGFSPAPDKSWVLMLLLLLLLLLLQRR